MAITLAESRVGMVDHVDQMVIDEFRRGSILLDTMTFDNCVSPGTGGSTLVYGYQMLKTPATAGFREINAEYSPNEAKREKKTVELKIFGGAFQVDRVIARTSGAADEVGTQLTEKIKATTNTFHNAVINGDDSVTGFDGLDVLLAGSSTEVNTDVKNHIMLATAADIDSNYMVVLDALDAFLGELDGAPGMLMGNSKLIAKLQACARRAGYLSQTEDAFGKKAAGYNGIPFMDLKQFYDGATNTTRPIVPILTRKYGASGSETEVTGLTDLFAVRFGLDAFHGVTPEGDKLITTTLPDFTTAGAVKTGDVEMVAAVALKNSRSAGVLRNFKIQ